MQDSDKTKEELMEEVKLLRQFLSEYEQAAVERKEIEDAIKRSEREKALILENTFELIIYRNTKMETIWASQPLIDWLGCTREEMVGRICYKARYNRDEPCDDCWVVKTMETKQSQELENTSDNGKIWFVKCNPVFDDDHEVIGTVEISQDITARKLAEHGLRQHLERLGKIINGTKDALARIMEVKDPYTSGHQRRVTKLACAIAEVMDFSTAQIDGMNLAGLLHDIGKIAVPSEILNKPRGLTDLEFNIVKTHPQVAFDILKSIDFPWPIAEIVYQHHERMNCTGYPRRLSGDDMLLESKILSVADVVEAISSFRPYRPALGTDAAIHEIVEKSGVLYDRDVVNVCAKLFRERHFEFSVME